MYGKPHLSIWGEAFAADRPDRGHGAFATRASRRASCRRTRTRATTTRCSSPTCRTPRGELSLGGSRDGRRAGLRQRAPRLRAAPAPGRPPGQAFAEAQYRCRDILERWGQGRISRVRVAGPHHAALLIAFVHLDVGRLAEASSIADDMLAALEDRGRRTRASRGRSSASRTGATIRPCWRRRTRGRGTTAAIPAASWRASREPDRRRRRRGDADRGAGHGRPRGPGPGRRPPGMRASTAPA